MVLNLLQICTRALDDISSFNVPTFIVGNDEDDTARTLLSAAFKVGEEMVRDYNFQEMSRTGSVTTVASTNAYDLPADYDRLAPDTMWNNTEARYMFGSATRRRWASITNSNVYNNITFDWRLAGGQIQIFPTPESVFTFNYEYLSKQYCKSSAGVKRTDGWAADSDLTILPHDIFIHGIRYYFSDSKNLAGATRAAAEYDAVIQSRVSNNKPSERINMAGNIRIPGQRNRFLNIPDRIEIP